MNNVHLIKQCRSLVPLSTIREQHMRVALDQACEITVCKNTTLFAEHEALDELHYLLSGEVLLKHHSGRERIITADFHWLPIVQFQADKFSAMALTDCVLLKFDREKLDNILTWSQAADYLEIDISYDRNFDDDADWMTSILNSNLFYKIPPLNVFSIYDCVSSVNVNAGEIILKQGDEGDYCYFIKEGKAKVTRINDHDQEELLAEIALGQCFGEDALIKNTRRNASVSMLTNGVLIRLHKADFAKLLQAPFVDNIPVHTLESIDKESMVLLDVRTQEEFDYKHIKNALHIPFHLLRLKVRLLDPEKNYLVYCNTGARSYAAAVLLSQKGYKASLLEKGLGNISQEQVETMMVSDFDTLHQMANDKY